MGSFLLKPGGSMRPTRSKYAQELFLVAFLFSWVPSAALLSPKGVNYEGNPPTCFDFTSFFPFDVFFFGFAFTVQALMGIKASLKDPHSVLENWDQDSVDPCSWTMVTCSSENLVIGL